MSIRVEELELLVRVASVHNVKILLFQPVHLCRLHCQPGNVTSDEDCSTEAANKERHQPFLVTQESHIQMVKLVVELSCPSAPHIGMVDGAMESRETHIYQIWSNQVIFDQQPDGEC